MPSYIARSIKLTLAASFALLLLQGAICFVLVDAGGIGGAGLATRAAYLGALSLAIAGSACSLFLINRGMRREVKRRSEAEAARGRVEERLRLQSAALEAAANGVVITDREGTIIWVNHAFTRLTGYTMQETVGHNTRMLKSGCHSDDFYAGLWDTILSGRPWRNELVNRRRDGSLYSEEVTITPVLDERGVATHFIGIKLDITERKRAEEELLKSRVALAETNRELVQAVDRAGELTVRAEKASLAKSQFLAMMSHEIRTPMHAIIGMSHLLHDTVLSVQQRRYLEVVSTAANSLLGVVNDILDFSKIEAGKLEIEEVAFDPHEVAGDVVALFQAPTALNGVALSLSLDPALPRILLGDPLRLSQILTNLLSNAAKFTRHGAISVSAKVVGAGPGEVSVEFSVADTGDGIGEEDQAHLFHPFKQVDGSITRSHGGTGLGLAICRQLAALMGGRIWCRSTPGEGSVFTFSLPFPLPAGEVRAPGRADLPAAAGSFLGQRVLLVEDNEINRLVAAEQLKKFGLSVIPAENGLAALHLVREERFDLVLMDVQMPVLDGLEATRRLRRSGVTLPIVALTANAMPHEMKECIAAGMSGYLAKPFTPDELYAAVCRWLPGEPASGEARRSTPPAGAAGEAMPAQPLERVLDYPQGVRQVGGNPALYRDLLVRFETQYRLAGGELAALVEAGDGDGASLLAHSLKGIAGILAAGGLQRAAREAEEALKGEQQDLAPRIDAVQAELDALLAALQEWRRDDDAVAPRSTAQEGGILSALADEGAGLAAALRESDPARSTECLIALQGKSWRADDAALLARVGDLVGEYRYAEALALLDALSHREAA